MHFSHKDLLVWPSNRLKLLKFSYSKDRKASDFIDFYGNQASSLVNIHLVGCEPNWNGSWRTVFRDLRSVGWKSLQSFVFEDCDDFEDIVTDIAPYLLKKTNVNPATGLEDADIGDAS